MGLFCWSNSFVDRLAFLKCHTIPFCKLGAPIFLKTVSFFGLWLGFIDHLWKYEVKEERHHMLWLQCNWKSWWQVWVILLHSLWCSTLSLWFLHTLKPPKVHRQHNHSHQNNSPGYCTCLNGFTVCSGPLPFLCLGLTALFTHSASFIHHSLSVCVCLVTKDRCWEAERRPHWMLCYAVACLTDKRTLNLTVLLERPRSSLAFRGAQGKQRASLCLQGPKGRWWREGGHCAGNPNDWHVFTLSPVWWSSGQCCLFLLKIVHFSLRGNAVFWSYKSQMAVCHCFD